MRMSRESFTTGKTPEVSSTLEGLTAEELFSFKGEDRNLSSIKKLIEQKLTGAGLSRSKTNSFFAENCAALLKEVKTARKGGPLRETLEKQILDRVNEKIKKLVNQEDAALPEAPSEEETLATDLTPAENELHKTTSENDDEEEVNNVTPELDTTPHTDNNSSPQALWNKMVEDLRIEKGVNNTHATPMELKKSAPFAKQADNIEVDDLGQQKPEDYDGKKYRSGKKTETPKITHTTVEKEETITPAKDSFPEKISTRRDSLDALLNSSGNSSSKIEVQADAAQEEYMSAVDDPHDEFPMEAFLTKDKDSDTESVPPPHTEPEPILDTKTAVEIVEDTTDVAKTGADDRVASAMPMTAVPTNGHVDMPSDIADFTTRSGGGEDESKIPALTVEKGRASADRLRARLDADVTEAKMTKTEAGKGGAFSQYQEMTQAIAQMRREMTRLEKMPENERDTARLAEIRSASVGKLNAYRKSRVAVLAEVRDNKKRTEYENILPSRVIIPHYYRKELADAIARRQSITVAEAEKLASGVRAEYFSKNTKALYEKAHKILPSRVWGKRLGLAALLGFLASPLVAGERDVQVEMVKEGAVASAQANEAALKGEITEWQRKYQEALLAMQESVDTLPSSGAAEKSGAYTPDRPPLQPEAPSLDELDIGIPAYIIDPNPENWKSSTRGAEVKEAPQVFTIPKGCTLTAVMEGKSTPPQVETLAKAAALSEEALDRLMNGIIAELSDRPDLAQKVGIKEKFLHNLFLDEGQDFTSDNLKALEDVAKRIADQLEIFEEGDLQSHLSETRAAEPEEELSSDHEQVESPLVEESDEQPQAEAVELTEKTRWLEIPQKDSKGKEGNFSDAAYLAYLAGKIPGITLATMNRQAFLERLRVFESLTRNGQNPEIMESMGVRDNRFEAVQPGDEIDLTLFHEFMLDPTMRLKDLKAEAEKLVNENR